MYLRKLTHATDESFEVFVIDMTPVERAILAVIGHQALRLRRAYRAHHFNVARGEHNSVTTNT